MEDRIYTIGEIKEMCMQSYMRGMSIQYDNDMKIKRKNTTPPFSKTGRAISVNAPPEELFMRTASSEDQPL